MVWCGVGWGGGGMESVLISSPLYNVTQVFEKEGHRLKSMTKQGLFPGVQGGAGKLQPI